MRMLGKIATTLIGTRIAAETGKAGLLGTAAGMIATRIITRSPVGAMAIGGAYVAHRLWRKKREIDAKGPHQAALDDGYGLNGASPKPSLKQRAAYRKAKPVKTDAAVKRRPATP